MAKEWARVFYDSPQWRKQRLNILKRDRFICTTKGCHNAATEVHHIIELTESNINDLNICLNENNLTSLCHDCHTRITKESKSKANVLMPIYFDENGYPVESK